MSRTKLVQILSFIGVIGLYLLLAYVLWRFLDWYIAPDSAKQPSTAKKDLFQALGFILAGTAGVVGIYFTWRNLSISQATLQSTREAQTLEREGQALERFGRAVEFLAAADADGKPKIESRVAGIYTLEGIGKGSPAQFEVIMNILNSYIRNNAPLRPRRSDNKPASLMPQEPSQDIQVSVSALCNLHTLIDKPLYEKVGTRIDLSYTRLQGVQLRGASLVRANLASAVLNSAELRAANLKGASLVGADLTGADLQSAILQGNLTEANLTEANLQYAHLEGASLRGVHLNEAKLQKARLEGAHLDQANLKGADLTEADLREANLRDARGVTEEQIAQVKSLDGATMPDGRKYEDWIKDKEGSGKDVENE